MILLRTIGLFVGAFISRAVGLILILVLGLIFLVYPRQYVTTDINNYGHYTGNINNDFANEFIPSFFPAQIEDSFTNVKYSYRAQANDTYAFEAYLELQIDDPEKFAEYIGEEISTNSSVFSYDPSYREYIVADQLSVSTGDSSDGQSRYHIHGAKIGKILYSEETRQIIYVAIGVYDGGIVSTDFLCEYFDRFDINPKEYELALEEKKPEF